MRSSPGTIFWYWEIESRTNNCITFKESKGSGKYIGFVGHKGCYSYVGMQRTSQVLSLGRGCHYVGIILHEIGHALGLHHEHNRSDRDKYIKIHFENMKPEMAYSCKKLRNSQNFILTGYDYQSIMQYGKYAFTANGNVTLEVLDKSKTLSNAYDRHNITDSDAFLLNSMYSCPGYTRPPPKRIPSYFCGFEDEKCNFRNAADFPKAKVVEEEGNHFLRADIPGADYRILTPYYRMINIDICIQFKYRIIGQLEYELYFAASQGSGYFDKEIGFEDTNGWKTMQIDFHPKSTYMMMLEPVIKSTGESKFDFDDISIKYTRC